MKNRYEPIQFGICKNNINQNEFFQLDTNEMHNIINPVIEKFARSESLKTFPIFSLGMCNVASLQVL